jgi:single-strand DNA-binding protein
LQLIEIKYNYMSINKVILVGNVGKDPVVKYFDKGVAKASFPVATSETYNNKQGETITSTEWHNVVFWRALAEVAEKSVKKGAQVYITGTIKTRSYVDKDGNNKYITEILGDALVVLDKKPGVAATGQANERGSDEVSGSRVVGNGKSYTSAPAGSGGPESFPGKPDSAYDEGFPGAKNEDDLPF